MTFKYTVYGFKKWLANPFETDWQADFEPHIQKLTFPQLMTVALKMSSTMQYMQLRAKEGVDSGLKIGVLEKHLQDAVMTIHLYDRRIQDLRNKLSTAIAEMEYRRTDFKEPSRSGLEIDFGLFKGVPKPSPVTVTLKRVDKTTD